MTSDNSPNSPAPAMAEIRRARELAAQAWCQPSTSRFVMQPELCEAFAQILARHMLQAPGDKGKPTAGLDLEAIDELYAKGQREFLTMQDTKRLLESIPELVKRLRSIPAPAPLVWTKEKPTEDGDYQFRYGPHHPRVFVAVEKVERYGGGMFVWNERNECHEAIGGDTWNGEWAGPIPQPSPTKGTENTPSHPADQ